MRPTDERRRAVKSRIVLFTLFLSAVLAATGCARQDNIKTAIPDALDKRVGEEIIGKSKSGYGKDGEFQAEAHALLGAVEQDGKITVYLYVLYLEYDYDSTSKFVDVSGGSNPAALTFQKSGESYILTEYWIPTDGSGYAPSIKEKFPSSLIADALNNPKYADGLKKECDSKAAQYLVGKQSSAAS